MEAFRQAWTGSLTVVPSPADRLLDSYMKQIQQSSVGGAQALVVLTFSTEAAVILRESLESGVYTQFLFGDALRTIRLAAAVDGGRLADMYGTASGPSHETAAALAWDNAFRDEYGKDTEASYVKETYDATMTLILAAAEAGSVDGAAIRDELRRIGSAPGETVLPGPEGVAKALDILRDGKQINYEGASSSIDWDENGDLLRGYIGIWRFTADGAIEEVRVEPYER